MAELTTIARPYAKAVFQFALEKNALETWSKTLNELALIANNQTVKTLLSKPQTTVQQKAELFASVSENGIDDATKNLLIQLAANKRLEALPAIYELYEALLAEQQKTVDVNVTSAFVLNDAEAQILLASLKTRLGREVKMKTEIDKSLIGGVIVRAGDLVIDASVKGKLAKLKNVLNT